MLCDMMRLVEGSAAGVRVVCSTGSLQQHGRITYRIVIVGGKPLKAAKLQSHGDHRIAMAFAIAGLFAEGETVIEGCECINTSYPGFSRVLDLIRKGKGSAADLAPKIIPNKNFIDTSF